MGTSKPTAGAAASAVLLSLAVVLSSCSGSGGTGDHRPEGRSSGPSARTGHPSLPQASRFPVPEGFDNSRGWTEAVTDRDSRMRGSWAIAPASGLFIQAVNNDGEVHARRLSDGEEMWTYQAGDRLKGARTLVYVSTGREGEELAVVVRTGHTTAEGLARSRTVLTMDTVPMVSRGKAKAARHLEFPDGEAGLFAGGLLVGRKADSALLAINPFSGKKQVIKEPGKVRLSRCRLADLPPGARCEAPTNVRFATTAGPVFTYTQDGYCDYTWKPSDYVPCGEGFTVGTAWRSEKVAPDGAADGTPLAVVGPYVVVAWTRFPEARTRQASERDVVAVHALADGELVARVNCDISNPSVGTGSVGPLAAQAVSRLSPSGDYLVAGQVGFDLAEQGGACFADTAKLRGVTLTAVDDTGRAFGVSYQGSTWADVPYGTFPHDFGRAGTRPARVVTANLRTGTARPLRDGTALPVHLGERVGLFLVTGTLAAYPTKRADASPDGEKGSGAGRGRRAPGAPRADFEVSGPLR